MEINVDLVKIAKAAAKQVVGKGKIMAAYAAIDKSLSENMTILEALNSVSSDGVIKSNIRLTFFEMVSGTKAAQPEKSGGVATVEAMLDQSEGDPAPDTPTTVMPTVAPPDSSAAPSEPAKPKAKKSKGKKKSKKTSGWKRFWTRVDGTFAKPKPKKK
jgi:hypothetical protein